MKETTGSLKVNPALKKLYAIIRDLDCELQMIGVRSGGGIFPTPSSARETLTCCLFLLSKEPNASEKYLTHGARHLIDREIECEVERPGDSCNCADVMEAEDVNAIAFADLLSKYRVGFTHYARQRMKVRTIQVEGAA